MSIRSLLKQSPFLVKNVNKFRRFKQRYKGLNWIKTIRVNFKTLDAKTARKLPIFVYGKLTIFSLRGKIQIEAPIKKGMIKWGVNSDRFSGSKGSAAIKLNGTIIAKGSFKTSVDYLLDVEGTLVMEDLTFLGNAVKIRCGNSILLKEGARIASEAQIFDTNFHYTRNVETGKIYPLTRPVVIGKYSWVGNRVTVMKGTVLPDYSIVASNSLLNKDYTINSLPYPTFAGSPAKMIASGNVRIFDVDFERSLDAFFSEHPEAEFYQGETGWKDEKDYVAQEFID